MKKGLRSFNPISDRVYWESEMYGEGGVEKYILNCIVSSGGVLGIRNVFQSKGTCQFKEWNSQTTYNRRAEGLRYENPKMTADVGPKCIDYFLYFLPVEYFKEVILPETNLEMQNGAGGEMSWGEFVRYLGLWILMSTVGYGGDRWRYFSSEPISPWNGAPWRLGKYMTGWKFERITSSLRLTAAPRPSYCDKFHKVRSLIDGWNEHMKSCFIPGWVSCLDESISIWTSRWTCPGFMYVLRKPHPMGNEYNFICCGVSEIMFAIELVEGKDEPKEKKKKKFHKESKTAGLLLRLCEGIFGTGKIVILDSGFCVLLALIELKKMGVYASALVKKRRYWPKFVKGDAIAQHFEDKPLGTTERLPGMLDGEKFDLFCMKDDGYVMTLMSTYGSLQVKDSQRESVRGSNGETSKFKYTEVIANHFDF